MRFKKLVGFAVCLLGFLGFSMTQRWPYPRGGESRPAKTGTPITLTFNWEGATVGPIVFCWPAFRPGGSFRHR